MERGGKIEIFVRVLFFEVILVICRKNLYPDRVDRNTIMNDRLVALLSADKGLNISRRQAAVGVQLLAGDGIVSGNADALGNIEIQHKIVVKKEIMDLDVEQVFLRIQPVVTAAELRRKCPAASGGAEFLTARSRNKAAIGQQCIIVIGKYFTAHSISLKGEFI